MKLHPATRLLLWCLAVGVTQCAAPAAALLLAAGLLVGGGVFARARLRTLLFRSRFVLISIAGVFAFATPGHLIWPALGAWSPSLDGVHLARDHAARLVAVIALVALLLEHTSAEHLVGGLYALMLPARRLGLDASRAALRLMLVLRYCTGEPPGRQWRAWLDAAPRVEDERVVLPVARWQLRDAAALAAGCAVWFVVWRAQ